MKKYALVLICFMGRIDGMDTILPFWRKYLDFNSVSKLQALPTWHKYLKLSELQVTEKQIKQSPLNDDRFEYWSEKFTKQQLQEPTLLKPLQESAKIKKEPIKFKPFSIVDGELKELTLKEAIELLDQQKNSKETLHILKDTKTLNTVHLVYHPPTNDEKFKAPLYTLSKEDGHEVVIIKMGVCTLRVAKVTFEEANI